MEKVTENEGLPSNKDIIDTSAVDAPRPLLTKKRNRKREAGYNDNYRMILNEVITETVYGIEPESHEEYQQSQLGATFWSREEKQRFFLALNRLGKHDIRGISTAVGTKSELEVRVYSLLLSQFLTHYCLHGDLHQLLRTPYLPAAVQIGHEYEKVLDELADKLSAKQLDYEIGIEKKKHNMGLLDFETAKRLTENMANDEDSTGNASELSKAIDLLNLEMFLNLSEGIFMNSSRPEENWHFYAEGEETPSMFPTAFLDFYNLTLSITKRLVQSTLHFAMSRIKAGYKQKMVRQVQDKDVIAALNVLGIECNKKEYWAKVARRCKLHISIDTRLKKEREARLRYSQVESILMQNSTSEEDASISSGEDEILAAQLVSNQLSIVHSRNEEERYMSTSWSSSSDSIPDDTHSIPARYTNPKRRLKTLRHQEKVEDAYMQAYDLHNSHEEERRLWISLGREPPKAIESENLEFPKMQKRKDPEDLIDWRDQIQFKSPWERYGTPVLAKSFKQNKRLCRRARPTRTVETTAKETESENDNDLSDHDSGMEDEDVEDGNRHEQQIDEEEREEEEEEKATDMDVDVHMDVDLEREEEDEGLEEEESAHEDEDANEDDPDEDEEDEENADEDEVNEDSDEFEGNEDSDDEEEEQKGPSSNNNHDEQTYTHTHPHVRNHRQ